LVKKIREVVYLCGRPDCEARIVLPDRGEAVKYPHRDRQGFRCEGLMVKYSLSPVGRLEEMRARWRIFLKERKNEVDPRFASRGKGK